MIKLYDEDCETLIAFIKMHEREEITDDVWNICMNMYDAVYGTDDILWFCADGERKNDEID